MFESLPGHANDAGFSKAESPQLTPKIPQLCPKCARGKLTPTHSSQNRGRGTVNLDSRQLKPQLALYSKEILRRKPKMKLELQAAGALLLTVTLAKAASTRFCRLCKRVEPAANE